MGQVLFHQDHVHPFASFENKSIKELNLDEETLSKWKRLRNTLPNLQFLEGKENESKNKIPLNKWVEEGNDFLFHPKNVSLELKDFEKFYSSRRELMLNQLFKVFDIK